MAWTDPVTVTLPGHQVEILRAMVATGRTPSMSAWIAAAVADGLDTRQPVRSDLRSPEQHAALAT